MRLRLRFLVHFVSYISYILIVDPVWQSADLIVGAVNKDKPAQGWYNGRFTSPHYNDTISKTKRAVGCSADEKNGEYSIYCFFLG